MKNHYWTVCFFLCTTLLNKGFSQSSWKEILKNKKGSVEINYYDSETYIIEKNGQLTGIEYDLFLAFFSYLENKYGVQIDKKYLHAPSFGSLFDKIKHGKNGQFGACSFSMTNKRMLEVNFSPKYMPDIEVMVCSKNFPIVEDTASFIRVFKNKTCLVVRNTTFEEDLKQIQKILPNLKVKYTQTGVEILDELNKNDNYFGFSELSNYILCFQKGVKIKRQSLFRFERMGHGFIFPKGSDWKEPIEAFFNDPNFKPLMNIILKKHLGNDINDLLWEMEGKPGTKNEINLLNKELDIQRMEIEQNELEQENQELIRNIFIVSIMFTLVFVFFLIIVNRRNRKKNKLLNEQKTEILLQKHTIEESTKNVIDSINYAKNIQESILPSNNYFSKLLPDSFVIYKPKDIISGDFYFVGIPLSGNTNLKIFAVGDCTGHGVPGALLTIIGNTFLQLSLKENTVNSCADALNFLNLGLAQILRNKSRSIQEGMDIAFCAVNYEKMELEFAGGNNPCFIIRNKELTILKPDKHGVGQLNRNGELMEFNNQVIDVKKGDTVYIFSDGFADQFGGPESYSGGKKYKISRFKDLLLQIQGLDMSEQKIEIEKSFIEWKGNLEQVDDVCIIGVRI